tara:strand:+ start:18823 stop:19212 length:390 start_codon:yes stop_codon:yes gene_type:complete
VVKRWLTIIGSLVIIAFFLYGCSFREPTHSFNAGDWAAPPLPENASSPLGVLNWTAALCILGGVIALVMTSARIGKIALGTGIGMVILSYVMSAYALWVLIPALTIFTSISIVWGYQIITKLWKLKKAR